MQTSPAWPDADGDPRAAFAVTGAAALGRVLDDDQLAIARAAFDELLPIGTTGPYATIVHDGWRRAPALAALVPAIAQTAARAIGVAELVLFHEHLLWKPPGGDDMAWHQDYSYLPLDRPDGCTLWIALDDCDPANGCLYYLLGTHTAGEYRAAWGIWEDDDPRAALPPLVVPDDQPGLPAPTAAGHAIAHHTLLLHRSPRNTAPRPRRAWALSLVTPDARWAPRHAHHPRSAVVPRAPGDPLEADLLRATVR
ncbi:MAG: phytanoyl-CoA dioxygenase family protein [Myxococcales bacterium]|nr:phytanoyl-CoA dioxygenase family protein [Myxococcales bacterium]